jgi:ATP-binding cassette subfamily B (MDR/TAP) protein 1
MGVLFSKMINLLGVPLEFWNYDKGEGWLEKEVSKWAVVMTILAVFNGIGVFIQKISFATLGNNVTLTIRKVLYSNILQKNIGWFDDRDNGPSVLTSAIASDTALINGVSTESLGPMIEAFFSLVGGIAIAFYFCWEMSLVCMAVSPILIIGAALGEE